MAQWTTFSQFVVSPSPLLYWHSNYFLIQSLLERNDGDMETFQDWLEQFEMIDNICVWSHQAKLINLVTRL